MCYKLPKKPLKKPLFVGSEWTVAGIQQGWDIIQELAKKYSWEGYPVQFEIITANQMLQACSSVGMPVMYNHWSFGKSFLQQEKSYKEGKSGLAYEMIINSSPSVCYIMEDNTQMMQLLVTAHAAIGHNHFFKNNYLFQEWTDPETIISYLSYAKKFLIKIEEEFGIKYVEYILDAAHTLKEHSVYKYKRKHKTTEAKQKATNAQLEEIITKYNPTLDGDFTTYKKSKLRKLYQGKAEEDENLLMFIAENAVGLKEHEREILRIVANIEQYFYPQMQTKVINEGFASFAHYTLMHDLHKHGIIDDGYLIEFYESHSGVLYQPDFDMRRQNYLNPYNVGFNIFQEIRRICESPTEDDYKTMPLIAGTHWIETVNDVVRNYKDETFIRQFLTPSLMTRMKLMRIETDESKDSYVITGTHHKEDYEAVKNSLAESMTWHAHFPDIKISSKDDGSKHGVLCITLIGHRGANIDIDQLEVCVSQMRLLWGGHVEVNQEVKGENVVLINTAKNITTSAKRLKELYSDIIYVLQMRCKSCNDEPCAIDKETGLEDELCDDCLEEVNDNLNEDLDDE